jgi:hypothetical protein
MGKTGRVRVAGPLAVFADGFRGELERGGYSRSTVEAQLLDALLGFLRGLDVAPGSRPRRS